MTKAITKKYSINLLQPELIPEKPLWSLKRVVLVWALVTAVMVAWILLSQHQVKKANERYAQLKQEKTILNEQMSRLENELAVHKSNTKLKQKIDMLTLVLNNKTRLHKELTDTTKTQVAGFAQSMTELSQNHHKGISLSAVSINNDAMTFSGLTKDPQYVPAWLAGFENSTFLSGKRFINFAMQENQEKIIEFTVSSDSDLGTLNNE